MTERSNPKLEQMRITSHRARCIWDSLRWPQLKKFAFTEIFA